MAQTVTRRKWHKPKAHIPDDHPLLEGIREVREAARGLSPEAVAEMEVAEAALCESILAMIAEEEETVRMIAVYEKILGDPTHAKYPKTAQEMKARSERLAGMKKDAFDRLFPAWNKTVQVDIPNQEAMRESLYISGVRNPEWVCACGGFITACNSTECASCFNKRQKGESEA